MNEHDIAEQAYKNGYEQGKRDAEDEIRILKQKRANIFEIVNAYERGMAAAVKHGRNETKQHPVDEFICSICGYVCHETHKYVYDEEGEYWSLYEFEFKYCPNCGAKMDGDGNA